MITGEEKWLSSLDALLNSVNAYLDVFLITIALERLLLAIFPPEPALNVSTMPTVKTAKMGLTVTRTKMFAPAIAPMDLAATVLLLLLWSLPLLRSFWSVSSSSMSPLWVEATRESKKGNLL
jgi:hypothetical protein